MRLVIVSGRSGSGKSTALNVLEDLGFYCIDNLPVNLVIPLAADSLSARDERLDQVAVSIDARNLSKDIVDFPEVFSKLKSMGVQTDIMYLDAADDTLLKRYHSTRRRHPLSSTSTSLIEAIAEEREILEPLSDEADLLIDTSSLSMYELRDLVKLRIAGRRDQELALLFESFGFKNGVPTDADFVFDVRCLPNPYWDHRLREYSGLDVPVIDFLEQRDETQEMVHDIESYLNKWLPSFNENNRSYMTIAIGCTGGQHRSVYIAQSLCKLFSSRLENVQVRHRELRTALQSKLV